MSAAEKTVEDGTTAATMKRRSTPFVLVCLILLSSGADIDAAELQQATIDGFNRYAAAYETQSAAGPFLWIDGDIAVQRQAGQVARAGGLVMERIRGTGGRPRDRHPRRRRPSLARHGLRPRRDSGQGTGAAAGVRPPRGHLQAGDCPIAPVGQRWRRSGSSCASTRRRSSPWSSTASTRRGLHGKTRRGPAAASSAPGLRKSRTPIRRRSVRSRSATTAGSCGG